MGKGIRGGKKMKELILKQCKKCHTIVKVLEGKQEISKTK